MANPKQVKPLRHRQVYGANHEQVDLLKHGSPSLFWNKWRQKNPEIDVELYEANLNKADLAFVNLNGAHLRRAHLNGTDLLAAHLRGADLLEAELMGAFLSRADLKGAYLNHASLGKAKLRRADLSEADLSYSFLHNTDLSEANLSNAYLFKANLDDAMLYKAKFIEADLSQAQSRRANLMSADLRKANLSEADFSGSNFGNADLSGANLSGANLSEVDFRGACLRGVDLKKADLSGADFSIADLRGADLRDFNLSYSIFVRTKIDDAIISGSKIYGVSVWDLDGEFKEQRELVITPEKESIITVDNIKVAQFIYLLLNNKEIRDVINTLTSKTVLILGRFSIPERKGILDALRNKLREYDLLPIVFDFDRPTDKDITETIKTLAGLSYFVIADVTNPKSSPLELQATIPDYQVPFAPIIQEDELPFSMMADLKSKYNWVLDTISYDFVETLLDILKEEIIDRAIKKHDELRIIKANIPTVISGKELRKRGKRSKP